MIYTYALLQAAIGFALKAHGDQMYGKRPYSYHLFRVEQNVRELVGVHALMERIVAILHDVLEDTDVTFKEIEDRFGWAVATSVESLSKRSGEDYYDYIARCRSDRVALLVKKCDTMANLTQSFKEQRHKGIIKYTTQLQLLEAK